MVHKKTNRLTLSAMFLALGLVLPFFTGQIPQIGKMLLPMHIPVFLCALVCGWKYGTIVGVILPIMRSLLFSMPVMFPTAIAMAFELAAYGMVIGLLYQRFDKKGVGAIYASLIPAMIVGRCVWGIVQCILLGVGADGFTMQLFWTSAFVNGIPGILLQMFLIPAVMMGIQRVKE